MQPAAQNAAEPDDAGCVAALFAVDPVGLGGVVLRADAGELRDRWLTRLAALLPADVPLRRVPLHIGDERLLGGLDLAATLSAGRVVAQRGVLAEADGGIVVLAMAERLSPSTAARVAAVIDTHEIALERDGMTSRLPGRFGVVALDEGIGIDEATPARLAERFAFLLALEPPEGSTAATPVAVDAPPPPAFRRARESAFAERFARIDIATARQQLAHVHIGDDLVEALCSAALVLGIASLRAPLLAVRAACVACALAGRTQVDATDAALAARLVLAPRATRLPDAVEADAAASDREPDAADATPAEPAGTNPDAPDDQPHDVAPTEPADPPSGVAEGATQDSRSPDDGADRQPDPTDASTSDTIDDVVLAAAVASIPSRLLAALKDAPARPSKAQSAGRSGAVQTAGLRGRPSGVRRAEPRGGARLNLMETLRAAAPWQRLRRSEAAAGPGAAQRVQVRREDFHVTHFKQRGETTTVFVVDASGSSALHRLAEAKGAVELLLADCYVRRDSVAVIAFRGRTAELLLPPTRSLVRAKRSLAGLPGGGGTPLASGIDAAADLADAVKRRGGTPVVVLLTDGRANIGRDGAPGRARAMADATASAQRMRAIGVSALLMDTSPQPAEQARALATDMGALYLPLPHADARALSRAVREAGQTGRPPR